MHMQYETIEPDTVELLTDIYTCVDWKSIARNRYPTDVFPHRLVVAGNMQSLEKAIQKLCNGLGLSYAKMDVHNIKTLKKEEENVLEMFREQSIYLTLLTVENSKKRRGRE